MSKVYMSHNELFNINQLISESKNIFNEIKYEKKIKILNDLIKKTDKDPLIIYKGEKMYPRFVVWELTLGCNMRCGHCGSNAGERRTDELNKEEMLKVCDELGELECERLTLLGGEPLIHPHWEEVTSRLKVNGVRVNIITNGWNLDNKDVCDRIKKAGLSIVGISIDGMEESHDRLRKRGSFKKIVKGMDLLAEREVPIAVCTVVNQESLKDLDKLYNFLIKQDVKVWQIQLAAPQGRLKPDDPLLIKPHQIKQIFSLVEQKMALGNTIRIDLADNVGYFTPKKEGLKNSVKDEFRIWRGCSAGIYVLGIDSNGNIKGCQSLPSIPQFIEGNIRKQSLKDIWNNPDNFKYNRKFRLSRLSGYCAECKFSSLCKAGCTSMTYAYTGSTGNNPMCTYRVSQEKRLNLNKNLNELKKQGKELIDSKEYRKAIKIYMHIKSLQPQDVHILDILGFLYYMTGQYEKAERYCEMSINIKPENFYAYKGLGLSLVEMGQIEEGINKLKKSIDLNPRYFDSHYDLAVTYVKLKQYKKARYHFNKALTIDKSREKEVRLVLKNLKEFENQ